MKLQIVVILACIYAVSADLEQDAIIRHMSDSFRISKEKVRNCMSKTKVTIEDLDAFPRTFENLGQNPGYEDSERRAMCFLVCMAQEKGLMIGSKLQITKIHDEISHEMSKDEHEPTLHIVADSCADAVKNISDECQVGLQFAKCVVKKMRMELDDA